LVWSREDGALPIRWGPVLTAPLLSTTTCLESVPISGGDRDTAKRNLWTAIEFLSPSNKAQRWPQEYLAKRSQLLRE